MRRNYSLFFSVIVVFSTLSLVSCNTESSLLGIDLLPPGEKPEIHYIEYDGVLGSLFSLDTMQVYPLRNVGLVGNLNDPVFGTTEASLIVQFVPFLLSPDFGTNPEADSLVVSFRRARILTPKKPYPYTGIYGDTVQPVVFSLYRLTNLTLNDSTRYPVTTEATGMYNPDFIAQITVSPDDTLLSFNLGRSLGNALIAMNSDSLNYADRRVFLSQFKGFYLQAEKASGLGSIFELDLKDSYSRMALHYHNTNDTLNHTNVYYVTDDYGNGPAVRFNVIKHDYSSAPFSGKLNDTTYNDPMLYLQGMAGIGIRLRFPMMDAWRARTDSTIAFHKVVIEVPADTVTYDSLLWRPKTVVTYTKDSIYSYPSDHSTGIRETSWDPYYGDYSKAAKAYRYLATSHFQKSVLDPTRASDLYLFNEGITAEVRERVIIPNDPAGRHIKLKVTYSLYPKK